MKPYPAIMAGFALLCAACTSTEYIEVEEDEGKIILNAQLTTDEDVHTVILHTSHISRSLPLADAEVKVYVNGTFVTEAQADSRESSHYTFAASFCAGDVVRITARKGGLYAEATTTVPAPAAILSVDTLSVRSMLWDEMEDFLQVKVRMQDVPAQPTWFRVAVYREDTGTIRFVDEQGQEQVWSGSPSITRLDVETDGDPIISEGGSSSGGLMSFMSAQNQYASFSDGLFADGECTIRVNLYPSSLSFNYNYFHSGPEYEILSRRKVVFVLYTISFWQYHYLKALDNLDTFDYETSFLIEPTTLPSNVEGGLGFVSVDHATSQTFIDDTSTISVNGLLYY